MFELMGLGKQYKRVLLRGLVHSRPRVELNQCGTVDVPNSGVPNSGHFRFLVRALFHEDTKANVT